MGRKLVNDDGTPAVPPQADEDEAPPGPADYPTPEDAKGDFLQFCTATLGMTDEQAEAAFGDQKRFAAERAARGPIPPATGR